MPASFAQKLAALNAELKSCAVEVRPYVADYSRRASKPWVLRSRRGDYIARYRSFERAEKAARAYEALI